MTMLKDWQDATGHLLHDYLEGKKGFEILERDDGCIGIAWTYRIYFAEYDEWPDHIKEVITHACGKVLDIGCGAGRHSLYLQKRGFDVVGIDNSPLAIETCRRRGLRKTQVLSITKVTSRLGTFDTILALGNNFGLFGSFKRARWLLRRFRKATSEKGKILTDSTDPYQFELPENLEYHELNRKKGRMPGQSRIRLRYRKYMTPWFDYLLVSKEEMEKILENTGWVIEKFIDGINGTYASVIRKEV